MDAKPEAPRKSSRRLAREYAVQGIYQSLLSGNEAPDIIAHLSEDPGFSKVDHKLFRTLLKARWTTQRRCARSSEPTSTARWRSCHRSSTPSCWWPPSNWPT